MGAQRHRGYLATGGTERYTTTGYTPRYCGVHKEGAEGGIRSAPSLPPRFLNTSTLQLETLLQHTFKKNHQSYTGTDVSILLISKAWNTQSTQFTYNDTPLNIT